MTDDAIDMITDGGIVIFAAMIIGGTIDLAFSGGSIQKTNLQADQERVDAEQTPVALVQTKHSSPATPQYIAFYQDGDKLDARGATVVLDAEGNMTALELGDDAGLDLWLENSLPNLVYPALQNYFDNNILQALKETFDFSTLDNDGNRAVRQIAAGHPPPRPRTGVSFKPS